MIPFVLIILFCFVLFYFWMSQRAKQQLAKHGQLSVSYLFQERPGQYSGDRSVKSGVIVIETTSHDKKLKHATIQRVFLKHPDLHINLDQSLVLPFQHEGATNPEVSIRYKVMKKGVNALDLTGVLTTVSGKLHFDGGKTKAFKAVVPISGLYQE